ncbi:MAG: PhnA domain-containing protein [Crocinitomicaceae bacterium]
MTNLEKIKERSNGLCELCGNTQNLKIYGIPPLPQGTVDDSIFICDTCFTQLENADAIEPNHWRFLNDAIWSELSVVKVVAWRMLNRLRDEGWPNDLLDMMYLTDEERTWAEATGDHISEEDKIIHKDANGAVLSSGDNVVLIKDLNVKGAGFTAKRGTAVRKISLVADNANQIEGKVEGQQIVILTQFVKKT